MTPHFGVAVLEKDGTEIRKLKYKKKNGIVSENIGDDENTFEECGRRRIW